ncbi:MAG: hypothetical protein A2287_08990 [Candidatus Melainabacteria bacterium RIFOXYA12_FULL_32_12]|nr:MAG: hypothetical protein A2255_05015 [Candidatus Melainabacteria bacterium RIFOXYA2_FULL_32_9]OGI28766.1 MAG: hypothetical protein A2287_08990 [Candidatus Melainabacteria bacterium RIFOXYA12_FULL_32_12]
MKIPKILTPINDIKDFDLVTKTKCKSVYTYHSTFLEEKNFQIIQDYIDKAKKYNFEFYINFKSNINESDLEKARNLLEFLITCPIDGILINSFDILEFIKNRKLPFKVLIDSGLNIHNLAGIEFVSLFQKIENFNITEEIYVKNLIKIKKYTKHNLSIDTDHLSWIADEVIKSKAIDVVVIKGGFEKSKTLLNAIHLIEQILENPALYKNQKLPFRNLENSYYKSNHFSGEFLSSKGKDFKFSGNIQQFNWKFKRVRLAQKPKFGTLKIPKLNIRLTSLEQLKNLKQYIKKLKFNPINSIEYGEIINTADLSRYSFNKIIEKVKKDCLDYDIKLQLSTPKILNERDFDRVYEYVKLLCIQLPFPSSIIVNNIGYWWTLVNDADLNKTSFELGQGLSLLNSSSVLCLANQHNISTVDLSNFTNIENIKLCIDEIKDKIPNRKLTIAGSVRIPSLGLCPLNNDSAVLSRLSCTAPCHRGNVAVSDPTLGKLFPIAVDGFCRMHLFKDQVLDLFKHLRYLEKIGINEFVIDFSGLSADLVPVLLNRFLNSLLQEDYVSDPDFLINQYEIK